MAKVCFDSQSSGWDSFAFVRSVRETHGKLLIVLEEKDTNTTLSLEVVNGTAKGIVYLQRFEYRTREKKEAVVLHAKPGTGLLFVSNTIVISNPLLGKESRIAIEAGTPPVEGLPQYMPNVTATNLRELFVSQESPESCSCSSCFCLSGFVRIFGNRLWVGAV